MKTRWLVLFASLILLSPSTSAQRDQSEPGANADAVTPIEILDRAEALQPVEAVIVAQDGEILAERGYRGISVTRPTNIKSASKAIISALIGIAIDRGILEGVDERIAPILHDALPPSMRASPWSPWAANRMK